jgi:hypothetical protein
MMLSGRSKVVEAVEANGHYTGEAIFTPLKAALDVLIKRFQRSFYTYRKLFWPVPVVRRFFLENRRVWRLWQFGWRCEFYSIENSIRPINTALSEKLLYIEICI